MRLVYSAILAIVMATAGCADETARSAFVFGRTAAPVIEQSSDPRAILASWSGVRSAPVIFVSPQMALMPLPGALTSPKNLTGVNGANFLRAAYGLGQTKEIFWVVPYAFFADLRIARGALQDFLRNSGAVFSDDELKSLRFEAGKARLILGGMPVNICTMKSLPRFSEAVLLHIDTTFFPVAAGEYGATSLAVMKALFDELSFRQLPVRRVSLSYGMDGGPADLLYRYLADELALGLVNPALFKQDTPPQEWIELDGCDINYRAHAWKKLEAIIHPLISKRPDDTRLLAFSAIAEARLGRPSAAETARRLFALDPVYYPLAGILEVTAGKAGSD